MKLKIAQDLYCEGLDDNSTVYFSAPCAVCKYFDSTEITCNVSSDVDSLNQIDPALIYEHVGDQRFKEGIAGCNEFKYNESKRVKIL